MFLGYPEGHAGDCYEMWDPTTGGVHVTRDIVWLRKMHFNRLNSNEEFARREAGYDIEMEDIDEIVSPIEEMQQGENQQCRVRFNDPDFEPDDEEMSIMDGMTGGHEPVSSRTQSQVDENFVFEEMTMFLKNGPTEFIMDKHVALVGAGIGGGFANTKELIVMTYDEAMAGPDRLHWEKAVEEEHEKTVAHGVWVPVN